MRLPIFLYCLLATTFGCKNNKPVDYVVNECKAQPAFVRTINIKMAMPALSTTENRIMGIALVDMGVAGRPAIQLDSSWKMAGWLGPMQFDPEGNCFVVPTPKINLLENIPEKQNTIFKLNSQTGKLEKWLELPTSNIENQLYNPYGVIGLTYLCEANILYAASIFGSSRAKQNGVIYAINAKDGTIIDKLEDIDAFGLGISYISEKRMLYFGSTRNSHIYGVEVDEKGKFIGNPSLHCSIELLGPRGNDKVKKIRFDKNTGVMTVSGLEFNYNLTAPTEKQETLYKFQYFDEEKKWQRVD
jgi:hypothetical protein